MKVKFKPYQLKNVNGNLAWYQPDRLDDSNFFIRMEKAPRQTPITLLQAMEIFWDEFDKAGKKIRGGGGVFLSTCDPVKLILDKGFHVEFDGSEFDVISEAC